jgi:Trypsin/Regulatory CLIP domain of proteinases
VAIGGLEFSASRIFIHASYNQPKFANDIAILELDRGNDSEINDAVCLPRLGDEQKSTVVVVKRANGSPQFSKAQLSESTECTSYFNQQLTELAPGQFCANVQSNATAYSPFIGAIAIESDAEHRYRFKGFTSTAIRAGQAFDESKPYIFTDIVHHLNWIQSAIGDDLKRYQKPLDETKQSLRSCSMSGSDERGFCVPLHQCSIYRDAPQPLSARRERFLDNAKCSSHNAANSIEDDGVCCAERYIEQLNATVTASPEPAQFDFDFDLRVQDKRGVELLDMQKCGQVSASNRIVGGAEADLKEFPWIALIKYKVGRIFKYTCGASLISDKFVLTCAHCITNLPHGHQIIAVRLGEYDRTTDPDCRPVDDDDEQSQQECNPPVQDISIDKLLPHPNYNTPRYANDIGLVRLTQKPDMSQGKRRRFCVVVGLEVR